MCPRDAIVNSALLICCNWSIKKKICKPKTNTFKSLPNFKNFFPCLPYYNYWKITSGFALMSEAYIHDTNNGTVTTCCYKHDQVNMFSLNSQKVPKSKGENSECHFLSSLWDWCKRLISNLNKIVCIDQYTFIFHSFFENVLCTEH